MRPEIHLGSVVRAKAGRDAGKYFAVVKIVDDMYVYIADGVTRRLSNPKLKKIKHLPVMPQILENISEKLENNQKVFDAELKKALGMSAEKVREE